MDKTTFDTLLKAAIAVIPPGLLRSLRFENSSLEEATVKICQGVFIWGKFGRALTKKGLTRAHHLQQNLQQQGTVTLQSRYGCGTVAIISL